MILGLCDRWHCPPSVIEAEDADRVLRLLSIVRHGRQAGNGDAEVEPEGEGLADG